MRSITPISLILLSALTLVGCGTTPVSIEPAFVAEPMPIDYKVELSVARLNRILASSEISNEQRAIFLYQRANQYDRLGLKSLARYDYDQALRLKPDFAEAYSSIGVYLTLTGQFDLAYEAFDSANELSPGYQFAYLSRGIALYYGGRAQLGSEDINRYLDFAPNDPYRVIWHYIVEAKHDRATALANLEQNATNVAASEWAGNIIKLYLQQIDETQFLATLNEPGLTATQKSERQCEAYFYLGKFRSFQGDHVNAERFYKLSLSTNVFEFIEHKYARLELDIKSAR